MSGALEVRETALPGVRVLTPRRLGDGRGFFSEVYQAERFAAAGIGDVFVQDNHAVSERAGTVRGLHFQAPPAAQAKLVRVARGRALDVVLDLRVGSPTYGRHLAVELSAEAWNQLYVPVGLAHGYCTLEPGTEILYKVSAPYAPETEGGVRWDDPALGIAWPVGAGEAVVSDKDRELPGLAAVASPFVWEGG